VYIIAPLATAKAAFSTLAGLLPEDHMELNMTKTQRYCPAPPNSDSWKRARAAARDLRIAFAEKGIVVCGSPVGSPAFEEESVGETVDKVIDILKGLIAAVASPSAQDATKQMAFRILRLCIPTQITHLLRSTPYWHAIRLSI
jgi:hypothetical protein